MDVRKIGWVIIGVCDGPYVHGNEQSGSIKCGEFTDSFARSTLLHGVTLLGCYMNMTLTAKDLQKYKSVQKERGLYVFYGELLVSL
jgi:hypothetical protein